MLKDLLLEEVLKGLVSKEYELDVNELNVVRNKKLLKEYKDMLEFLNNNDKDDDVCFVLNNSMIRFVVDDSVVLKNVNNNNYELIVFSIYSDNDYKCFVIIEDDRVLIGYIDVLENEVEVKVEYDYNYVLNCFSI